jgi:predicted outer membrane repeat protein
MSSRFQTSRLFRRFFRHSKPATPAVRSKWLGRVEALEERSVPAVFNVNSLQDILTPPKGVVTLRSAIEAANATPGNNTINLDVAGTYKISLIGAQEDNNATGDFDILDNGGSLTIQNKSGGTVVINGEGIDRVFDVNPTASTTPFTVTFDNLTITGGVASPLDGVAGEGGGIRAQGAASLVLNNDIITGNRATANGGGVVLAGATSTGTLTVNNSIISDNHAGDAGGGINADGIGLVTVNGGTLEDNTCVNQGAAIWLNCNASPLDMTGVVVTNNVAFNGPTGAIGNSGSGAVTITSCLVEDNSSATTGGGFGDQNMLGNLTVIDSQFIDNTAGTNGGAIQAGGPNTTVIIKDSVIEGNTANGTGGGVFLSGGTATITDTRISNNQAVSGGGIEDQAITLTLTNDLIQSNSALGTNAGTGALGGGLDIESGASTVTINNTLFLSNTAIGGTPSAGGAINQAVGGLTIANSQFTANLTDGSGGAISTTSSSTTIPLTVTSSTFNNNQAAINGGAIEAGGVSHLFEDTFVNNSAGMNGGALDAESIVALLNSTINDNTAGGSGGGVFVNDAMSIASTIIADNTAVNGPDVDVPNGFAIFDQSDFIGNLSGSDGQFMNGPITGVNPDLGPLQNNGGPSAGLLGNGQVVQTEALLPGSPAIGTGYSEGFTTDERGFARTAGGRTAASIGAFEPQYAANATANQVYVESLYETLLNETGDANAPNLVNQLNHHTSPSYVVQEIENTTLFKTNQAQSIYEKFLHIPATGNTLQNVVNQLGGGYTQQAEASILGSTQYFQLHGSNNTMFVDAMFEDVLGRLPDDTELAADLHSLSIGASRQYLAQQLLSTPEYFTEVAEAEIVSLTGSEPDTVTLTNDAHQLQYGLSLRQFVANLLSSTAVVANRD